ncbi:MAG: tetraacyldisaccharide 4'-kinase, partial [Elusimicrobia bacterium]|nr:tetraacyldisaccharide 4'-kinase [Elusimicrobiota bacterium]
ILSRGYGRTGQAKRVTALVDGKPAAWSECGDEPWLLQRCLAGQGVPILVSSDRFRAGERAVRAHGARVLILDDGFQHLRLRRDLDVVLLNALDPFGGGAVLPLGRLREPPSALRRAGLIVLTHADAVTPDKLRKLEERVRRRNPTAPILRAVHRPDALLTARGGELRPPSSLKGQRLASLCGLAEPAAFETLLERLGAVIEQRWRFPDHHPYTDKDLRSVARLGDGLPVVTTAKDLARLPSGWESSLPCELLVLTIRLEFIEGGEAWERALLRLAEAP